jgi:hypothetical protein
MTRLLHHPQVKPLLSDEHFSVDGTLIEAWASQRSFRPKDGSDGDGSDFHGQTRKNDTHQSTTDPDSRLYRKAAGREAKLCYMGHVTMENRHGLAVAGVLSKATGTAERRASEAMLAIRRRLAGRRITVGEDSRAAWSAHRAMLLACRRAREPQPACQGIRRQHGRVRYRDRAVPCPCGGSLSALASGRLDRHAGDAEPGDRHPGLFCRLFAGKRGIPVHRHEASRGDASGGIGG